MSAQEHPGDASNGDASNAVATEPPLSAVPNGPPAPSEKPQKTGTGSSKKDKGPAGGFDSTPVPAAPPGYTVKITFHRAENLPLADIGSLSSDPYVLAQIYTGLQTRHKEDPPLQLRTKTIRQDTNPVWNTEWIVANIPASGFKMKARIFDEDPADHDDRLGNTHVSTGPIDESWPGIPEQAYSIKKRKGSKRAYLLRALAVCFHKQKHLYGRVFISVEMLGRSPDASGGRAYTIGPDYWVQHFSPLLGRLLGQKEPQKGEKKESDKQEPQRYNFQANQFQLRGPVPEQMYHRFVEFKSFVKGMFTATGIRGFPLSKALHHQHARVYNFDRSTIYGEFQEPCRDMTLQFLDLVHYDHGGRIFTYVLTLDALFRFTETGKEFGIDMLSKHTMHSDVSVYVAFSGEFFIRRRKHHGHAAQEDGAQPSDDISGESSQDEVPKDPSQYELVIDNDSGTYRPNAELLPQLKAFFEANFPGLHVMTLDCQGDAEKMAKMKDEQRERKNAAEGGRIVYTQLSRSSSTSSSDVDDLDRLEQAGGSEDIRLRRAMKREAEARGDAAKLHMKEYKPNRTRQGWRGSKHRAKRPGDASPAADPGSAQTPGPANGVSA